MGYVMGSVNFKCVCPWFFYPQNRDKNVKFNSTSPVRYMVFFRNFLIRLRVRIYILWFAHARNLDLGTTYININVKKSTTVPHHLNLGKWAPPGLNLLIESFSTIYGFIYVRPTPHLGGVDHVGGNPGSIQLYYDLHYVRTMTCTMTRTTVLY